MGGAGVALPAITWSLTYPLIFLGAIAVFPLRFLRGSGRRGMMLLTVSIYLAEKRSEKPLRQRDSLDGVHHLVQSRRIYSSILSTLANSISTGVERPKMLTITLS